MDSVTTHEASTIVGSKTSAAMPIFIVRGEIAKSSSERIGTEKTATRLLHWTPARKPRQPATKLNRLQNDAYEHPQISLTPRQNTLHANCRFMSLTDFLWIKLVSARADSG